MSKKDYELIARVFATAHMEARLLESTDTAERHEYIDSLAEDMATEIRAYDATGRFNRDRFLRACRGPQPLEVARS